MSAALSPAALAFGALTRRPRANKYGAVKTTVDGITFDGKGEAHRWAMLQLMQRAGEISALERQVRYRLEVNGVHVCDYVADFIYVRDGARVVEDFKGKATREYRIKKKLMLAVHGIAIEESGRQRGKHRRPKVKTLSKRRP